MELEIDFDDRMGGFKDEKSSTGKPETSVLYPRNYKKQIKRYIKNTINLKKTLLQ